MSRRSVKRLVRRALARVAPAAGAGGVRVLLYHAVEPPDPADDMAMQVPPERFREQMAILSDDACAVVPLSDALAPAPAGPARVAITFDDGYRSQQWAAGVLRELGFPATFFVTTRFLDGRTSPSAYWEQWGHMGWRDAAALQASGFEIGAHSRTHPDLRQCSDAELDDEMGGAKDALEQRLGVPVVSLSYPYGRHDARVRDAARRAGYRLACTSRYGVNTAAQPPLALHRTEVAGTDDLVEFRWKLRGKYDWLARWQDVRP